MVTEASIEERPSWLRGLRARISASPWSKLAGKLGLYAAGFVALALVGSGRLLTWVPPAHGESSHAAASSASAPLGSMSAASIPSAESSSEADAGADVAPIDADAGPAPAVTADGKVALNRATEADLRRLPSIGATRAKAILALRDKLGRFKRVEDLLRIRGIGRKSLARLRPLVIVD